MAKDAPSREPKSHARDEEGKETGKRDYHMYDNAGKPTSNCDQAKSSCHQYQLETEPNKLLKLEPINTCTCQTGEEIREWERECNMCKRRRGKATTQIMAPIPGIRFRFTFRPFAQTAMDYVGPFATVQGRGVRRQKRWLCLITSLSFRPVHLEVAFGLDPDSFLNAFTRFTSRRGVLKEMVSDCETNFVGAANELKELVSELDQDKTQQSGAHQGVKWNFNPSVAPHFGGIHDVMIISAKKAIYGVIGTSNVTDEELITAAVAAESLLNSRPLTYHLANPQDIVPLAPNHFLHGQQGG
ncbi:hypothetical protein AWC38_SpisGene25013 [Stylophora pistillata]|uniref:Integrase catalytic domain-containing protein n=1 Tax=Stylophora pistillata TaxID=50429 RepID=A0A2B4R3F1_STYPI|nr:hypothetical protein AWC38_SpisGene25013 [Stylophora pistillata]